MSVFTGKNLDALKEKYPGFETEILSRYKPSEDLEIIVSVNGAVSGKLNNVWLHSSRAPAAEASRLAGNSGISGSGICVVFGFGLGYHIEALLENYPDLQILIAEPEPGIFLKSLESRDFAEIIKSPRTGFLLDTEPSSIQGILKQIDVFPVFTFKLRQLSGINEDYFSRLEENINEYVAKKETNRNTINRFGKSWVRNLFRNIPTLMNAGDISAWFGRFQGIPAIIAAAGPSLDSVMPLMPELKKRAVIICVDTAVRAFRDARIAPDFIVVVDPQYLNSRHLDNCLSDSVFSGSSILVSESSTHPGIFRNCPLPVYFCKSVFPLGSLFEEHVRIHGVLGAGGSVATSAWDLARRLGCREIYAAGLDLGYPGNKTHYKNSLSSRLIAISSTRLTPSSSLTASYLNSTSSFKTENNSGTETLTDKRLIIYKWWFENQLKIDNETVTYNLSPYGIKIDGMDFISSDALLDAMEHRENIENVKIKVITDCTESGQNGLKGIVTMLENMILECESLETLSGEAIQLMKLISLDAPGLSEYLKKLESIDRSISLIPSKELAGFILQPILNEILEKTDGDYLSNSKKLYFGIYEAASYHRILAGQALVRLSEKIV